MNPSRRPLEILANNLGYQQVRARKAAEKQSQQKDTVSV
jgi:hypothetical protein